VAVVELKELKEAIFVYQEKPNGSQMPVKNKKWQQMAKFQPLWLDFTTRPPK
jgi:hypothetical protein